MRASVERGSFTVTVEDDGGGVFIEDALVACKDAVGALGFHGDQITEAWQKVYAEWLAPWMEMRKDPAAFRKSAS